MRGEALKPGDVVAAKLRVVRLLGAGGMGAVYEVEHVFTKHRRALKMLHAEMAQTPSVVTRFLREASAAGRIGNAHVVETFDAGQLDTGEPYLVMEMLDGRALADVLEERGRLEIADTVQLMVQACEGVGAAHAAGIIHRDLKPDNLFLTGPKQDFVKILDFGISKFDPQVTGDHGVTREGTALGTPYYMPPEQVRGDRNIDAQADVYALGVVIYECLTGAKPFDAETFAELCILIHEGRFKPLRELRPDASPQLEDVVHTAMSSDRTLRYASMPELKGALIAARDGSSVSGGTVVMDSDAPPSSAVGVASVRRQARAPSGVQAASEPPRYASAERQGLRVSTHAASALSHTAAKEEVAARKRGLPWGWLAAGAGVIAIVAVAASRGPASVPASGEPAASADSSASAPQIVPAAASTTASPPAAPRDAGPPPDASVVVPSAPAVAKASKPLPAASGSAPPKGSAERAQQFQLGQENPF